VGSGLVAVITSSKGSDLAVSNFITEQSGPFRSLHSESRGRLDIYHSAYLRSQPRGIFCAHQSVLYLSTM